MFVASDYLVRDCGDSGGLLYEILIIKRSGQVGQGLRIRNAPCNLQLVTCNLQLFPVKNYTGSWRFIQFNSAE